MKWCVGVKLIKHKTLFPITMTTHWHHPKNALYTHVSRFSLETLNLFTKQEKQQLRVETLVLTLPAFTRLDQSDGRILPACVRTGPASSTGYTETEDSVCI